MKRLLSILALLQLFILPGVSARVGEWEVGERDFHSQVWQRTTLELDTVNGKTELRDHRYVELATGLNYQKDGQWLATREEIELLPNGFAVARQGPHQVIFNPNANSIPAVDLSSADGKRFQSRVSGTNKVSGTYDPVYPPGFDCAAPSGPGSFSGIYAGHMGDYDMAVSDNDFVYYTWFDGRNTSTNGIVRNQADIRLIRLSWPQ